MKLIINADDFGYSRGINYGIIDAYNQGVVSSTTIMSNMPGFKHAVQLAKENEGLGIGIHLVLTCGNALTGVNKTITDEKGAFFNRDALTQACTTNNIDIHEIEQEYIAQIENVIESGINPTHLDSHHHTHELPNIFNIYLKMAKKYNLAIRIHCKDNIPEEYKDIKSPDRLILDFFGEHITIPYLIEGLDKYKETNELIEIMCHPGYLDKSVLMNTSYTIPRLNELEILRSKEIINYIKENNIELCNFKAVNLK